jgi:hypothetical protein
MYTRSGFYRIKHWQKLFNLARKRKRKCSGPRESLRIGNFHALKMIKLDWRRQAGRETNVTDNRNCLKQFIVSMEPLYSFYPYVLLCVIIVMIIMNIIMCLFLCLCMIDIWMNEKCNIHMFTHSKSTFWTWEWQYKFLGVTDGQLTMAHSCLMGSFAFYCWKTWDF